MLKLNITGIYKERKKIHRKKEKKHVKMYVYTTCHSPYNKRNRKQTGHIHTNIYTQIYTKQIYEYMMAA